MKKISRILMTIAIMMIFTANCFAALTVAEARALGNDVPVEIGPVYISSTNDQGGTGYSFFAQDETGGVQLYGPAYIIPDFITSNNLVPGSCVILSGTNEIYYNIHELTWISVVNNYGVSNVPAATPIDISDLAKPAPDPSLATTESKLIIITGVDFYDSGTFQGGGSVGTYTIEKNGTTGTVRIQDPNDPLVGTAIPGGTNITIIGILSQFSGTYQIFPLEIIGGITRDPYLWREPFPDLNFGVVYPNYDRTLHITIKNGGEISNLNISAFSSVGGDTNKFSPTSIPDFVLTPGSATNFNFIYTPGSGAGANHTANYQFNSNDASNQLVQLDLIGASSATPPPTPSVWINEVAYDDSSTDDEEFIELCGIAGTDITGWKIQLYNGADGSNYYEWIVGDDIGSFTLPNDQGGFGFYVLAGSASLEVPNTDETMMSTIENGSDDAVRLTKGDGSQMHFFAYESKSAMTYPPGLPNDLTPLADSSAQSNSLSLVGTGVEQPDFSWDLIEHTPGELNIDQVLPEPGLVIGGIMIALLTFRRK